MKRAFTLLSGICLMLTLVNTTLQASTIKGKIFYAKTLKEPCGFGGDIMGKKHTSSEWKAIYENKKLNYTIKALCPKAPFIDSDKDLMNLFHFLNTFSSDSGSVPSC